MHSKWRFYTGYFQYFCIFDAFWTVHKCTKIGKLMIKMVIRIGLMCSVGVF